VLSGRPNRIIAQVLQHPQHRIHAERFAERSEAGQIDEDDRRILMYRREQEIGIFGQPLPNGRRLKLLQQIAFHRKMLRLPPVQPKLHRSEQDGGRRCGGERQRCTQPDAA
jgi:hypothetical protein